jgi:diaminohydroxyphosphoribosylaminopyrimidine deaminase / 5-amino-6-(5-phosphoribosylamino)uracil reductase
VLDSSCMPPAPADEQLLQHALELAREGIGLASPNPYVGAVITDARGNVVGTGTYTYQGMKHAEVLALEAAGGRARGGTLYINLEPHAHQGRTPPCTDALLAAGIRRVVASMPDPNPQVSGRGFELLRAAGVQVEVGGLEEQARHLNEAFAHYIRHGRPLVTLKSAMTLDGKIAPAPESGNQSDEIRAGGGFSGTWITGEPARAHSQGLRHQNDALLVGIGTILADNPLLTDRSGRSRRRPLLRVILDSRLRMPLQSRLVQRVAAERKNDVLIFCSSTGAQNMGAQNRGAQNRGAWNNEQKKKQLEQLGIRVEQVSTGESGAHLDLAAILRRLGQLEILSLMIEGGATVNSAALAADAVGKVFLYYAAKILGDAGAIPFAGGAESRAASQAARVRDLRLHRFGEDFAVEGYLRDPYTD